MFWSEKRLIGDPVQRCESFSAPDSAITLLMSIHILYVRLPRDVWAFGRLRIFVVGQGLRDIIPSLRLQTTAFIEGELNRLLLFTNYLAY